METIELKDIQRILPKLDLLKAMEDGFANYSKGLVRVPPVAEMLFEKGEVHIKYGYVDGGRNYVIKVASGFYSNQELGLPTSNGLMLLFSQDTGQLRAVLLDEGHLSDVRTALAGAVVARYLAPEQIAQIGVLGTGIQARLQLRYLKSTIPCRKVLAWGRNRARMLAFKSDMENEGFELELCNEVGEMARTSQLIISATPSEKPLIMSEDVQPGTHITAAGADTPDKQELDPQLLKRARVVADSLEQCRQRGEIYQAVKAGSFKHEDATEIGRIVMGKAPGRRSPTEITIADLTGVAVQDLVVAEAVYYEYLKSN